MNSRISRETFVTICTEVIEATRKKIKPLNQLTEYRNYRNVVKEKYLDNVLRKSMEKIPLHPVDEYLSISHKAIKHAGVGNCGEFAYYLFVELIKNFSEKFLNLDFEIQYVSQQMKHAYIRIVILLENEKIPSMWELEAWHPRIIDITKRPDDDSIKNAAELKYGLYPKILYSTSLKAFSGLNEDKIQLNFSKPKPDKFPSRSQTPEKEVFLRNSWLYEDHTIEEARKNGDLPKRSKRNPKHLSYLQKCSSWQKNKKSKTCSDNEEDDSVQKIKLAQ